MSLPFVYHLLITAIIFYVLATGFKFFLKLRLSIDCSYIAIIIFASYITALLNMHFERPMLATIPIAWLASIVFTILILYLSKRLSQVYFIVGTLALYMLVYQLSINRVSVTGGSFGLSGITRLLAGNVLIKGLGNFLIVAGVIGALVLVGLTLFKRTYIYAILKGRGENENILKILGVKIPVYTGIMIALTSLCAVIGANLYTYYYLYIDPASFWLNMLILLLVISFLSYKRGERQTFLISVLIIFVYEYLRFFKLVDPSLLGYIRESIFALLIMVTSFITFRKTSFGRDH